MEARRVLPLAAVALAGLLVGAWMAGGGDLPDGPPDPPPAAVRAAPRASLADVGDRSRPAAPEAAPLPTDEPEEVQPYDLDVLGELGEIRCAVEGEVPAGLQVTVLPMPEMISDALARGQPGEVEPDRLRATWQQSLPWREVGGELVLDAPVGTALLFATLDDASTRIRAEAVLSWDGDEASCVVPLTLTPLHVRTVAGRLRGVLDDDRIHVDICGNRVPLPGGASSFSATVELPAGPCLVHAARIDGAIYARSDMVEVDPAQGDATDLVLTMPEDDVGGIGVPVMPHPDGMMLGPPTPGTPAALAGLQAGDVVVAVDGQSVAGWDVYEIIGVVTGPIGTEVELTVITADGAEETVRVQRAWVDAREG